jgi:amino acid transporter
VSFAVVGVVVARHQPRNPVGWILIVAILLVQLSSVAGTYAVLRYNLGHRGLPLGSVGVLLDLFWLPGVALFPLVVLLFPDGRLTSRRWRPVLWTYVALIACVMMAIFAQAISVIVRHDVHLDSSGAVTNGGHLGGIASVAFAIVVLSIGLISLSFVAHQLLSWRRSSGERRQQVKWLAVAAAITLLTFVVSFVTPSAVGNVLSVGLAALPIGIGVGVLKYRLYEIDRLISRTLSYAIVTGLVVGVYVGVITLVTRVLGFSSPVAVAASTLAAVALFNPLRVRVQRVVDRRFNRAGYDAEATVADFVARLRDAVDLETVRSELLEVVNRAVEPAHASVWIRRRE